MIVLSIFLNGLDIGFLFSGESTEEEVAGAGSEMQEMQELTKKSTY